MGVGGCTFEIVSNGKRGGAGGLAGQDVTGAVSRGDIALYTMQAFEDCGPSIMQTVVSGRHVMNIMTTLFLRGKDVYVHDDDDLEPSIWLEMKKCRTGVPEQEFWAIPFEEKEEGPDSKAREDDQHLFILQHVLTNVTLGPQMDITEESPNVLELRRVFLDEEKQFYESDKYFYIETTHRSKSSSKEKYSYLQTMVSGQFAKTDFSKPEWPLSSDNHYQLPFSMWSLEKVDSTLMNDDEYDAHAKWLENKIMTSTCSGDNGGSCDELEYLTQLPPWTLLDVERDASKTDVKARFRQLSKYFHPDKKKGPLFEEVFVLLQASYEG